MKAGAEPIELQIQVEPRAAGATRFAIASAEACCEGLFSILESQARAERIDVGALVSGCATWVAGERLYDMFRSLGCEYGMSFQCVERLSLGSTPAGNAYALARLRLPASAIRDSRYWLHPGLLDAALQASVALGFDADGGQPETQDLEPSLPFSVDRIDVHAPCPEQMWVRVRVATERGATVQKLDFDLVDDEGRVCVAIRGASSRPVAGEEPLPAPLVPLIPAWDAVPAPAFESKQLNACGMVIAGGEPGQRADLLHRFPGSRQISFADDASVASIARVLGAAGEPATSSGSEDSARARRIAACFSAFGFIKRCWNWEYEAAHSP